MNNCGQQIFDLIYRRQLCIHAEIRFNPQTKDNLSNIMKEISPTSCTRFLMSRDRFFSYCNERDVWYGSETTTSKFISIQLLTIR